MEDEDKMTDTNVPVTNDYDEAPEKPESSVNVASFDFSESK